MLRKVALLITCYLCWYAPAIASHLMGGEITWDCLGNGQYQFKMKLYRDCNGIAAPNTASLDVFNHPTVRTIPLTLITHTDISPRCNGIGPAIQCPPPGSPPGGGQGAVEEYIYQSNPVTLTGIPPVAGWIFTYDDFSRNSSITNLQNPSNYGFTFRAIMYSFNGKNADPCFDASPTFLEGPKSIICTGNPFTYNQNAVDKELDSLTYSWAEPLDRFDPNFPRIYNPPGNPRPIPFVNGYSSTNPLPGSAIDSRNIPAKLNPFTGEISYTSYTVGNYVAVIKVQAWKCGQLVAEVFRDMQVVLLPCGGNGPPVVTTTSYADTVTAGALVSFTLTGSDAQLLPNGIPQTMTIEASGSEFGSGFTNTATGCNHPPCATLNPPPPVSGQNTVNTTFNWQTDCNHVLNNNTCNSRSNTYNFIIRTQDDFCPAPAINITTISITVMGLPVVPSPPPLCTNVQSNGDVTITWSQPPDPSGTFNSYHLYSSANPSGPFTVIDSIFNYNQLSYTHIGAGANSKPVYYYIKTRSGCNGMVVSTAADTIRSIHLKVTNPGNGTAILKWNQPGTPVINSSTGIFNVYREYPTGVWMLIGTTGNTSFTDSVDICSATLNYKVEIADQSGCNSVSSVDGGLFKDLIAPVIPSIDTISVDATGNVHISWPPSPSSDVIAYVIYKNTNGIWTAIDTVKGINNTSYINLNTSANTVSENYRIASYDSCKNTSPLGPIVNTILLTTTVDVCKLETKLSWNNYINLSPAIKGYRIYAGENGGNYTLIGDVGATQTSYIHTGLNQLSNYCYYVSVYDINNTKSASSNRRCVFVSTPRQPSFSYLKVATVTGQNNVSLSCHTDGAVPVQQYKVLRAEDGSGSFNTIGYIPAPPVANTITYNDGTAKTTAKSYYYKITVLDSCGFDGLSTNIGRTMLLNVKANSNYSNTLTWNDYEQWLGAVSTYNIYRGIDGVFDPTPVAVIPFANAGTNVYTDDVVAILNGKGIFSYYIEAIEGAGNPYAFMDKSLSNVADALQEPTFYIPNAFVPSGVNAIFKPNDTFIDPSDYSFTIFNRWGEVIFETTTPSQGWNGTYQSEEAIQGVYLYFIKYKSARGEYFERKGTVTLIR